MPATTTPGTSDPDTSDRGAIHPRTTDAVTADPDGTAEPYPRHDATKAEPSALLRRALAAEQPADAIAERILDAALDQFSRVGLARATVEDVARGACIARVTVYRRFASKNDLVEAVLLRECRRCLTALDAAVAGLPTIEARIVEGFAFAIDYARAHPLVGGLLEVEPQVILPFLTVHAGPATAAIREYLAMHLRVTDGEHASTSTRSGERMQPGGTQSLDGTPPDNSTPTRDSVPATDVEPIAELMVRIAVSFVISPDGCIPLRTPTETRAFAQRFLVPLAGPPPA